MNEEVDLGLFHLLLDRSAEKFLEKLVDLKAIVGEQFRRDIDIADKIHTLEFNRLRSKGLGGRNRNGQKKKILKISCSKL
jgi:hypothetical protein